jgi:hypothetical protein
MPRSRSSGSRSVSTPVSARTSTVLPWSMWPAVPRVDMGELWRTLRVMRQRGGRLETAAIAFLALGWVVPGLGWLVGAVLAGSSRTWSLTEKLIALPGMFAFVFIAWALPVTLGSGLSPVVTVIVSLGFSGVFSAYYLWRRLRVRRLEA